MIVINNKTSILAAAIVRLYEKRYLVNLTGFQNQRVDFPNPVGAPPGAAAGFCGWGPIII
jgi:hypothetical protein